MNINKINWVLNSASQTHFVDINTVDRGKMRNKAHRIDLKNVELHVYDKLLIVPP